MPKRSAEIPVGVLGRAKATVAKAKKTRDKDFKTAQTFAKDYNKTFVKNQSDKERAVKAQQKLFSAMDKAEDIRGEISREAELIGIESGAQKKVERLQAKLNKENERISKLTPISRKAEQQLSKSNSQLQALNEKRNSLPANKRTPKGVMAAFEKETEAASRIMFQNNLNEGKRVRGEMKNEVAIQKEKTDRLNKKRLELETLEEKLVLGMHNSGYPDNDPRAIALVEQSFQISDEIGKINRQIRASKKNEAGIARRFLQVNNPTVIRQAPGTQKDKVNSTRQKDRRKKGQEGFQELVSDDVVPKGSLVKYQNTDTGRAFQRNSTISEVHMDVFSGPDTVVHELGHTAENYNSRTLKRSIDFRDRRTAGEGYQPLADLTGNQGYRKEEKAKPDKFIHPYMGKDYGESASEIFSMGIEEMFRDPVGFAEKDPEMFDFIYAQARTP